MLNDQEMLVSFLYNIRAHFLFLSFAVSETYCILLCGVRVRVVLCCVYLFLCMLCKGGATHFRLRLSVVSPLSIVYFVVF